MKTKANRPAWKSGVYQEVDGFYYFDPKELSGCFTAHTLRDIAEHLDELNKPWSKRIDREFKTKGSLTKAVLHRFTTKDFDRMFPPLNARRTPIKKRKI